MKTSHRLVHRICRNLVGGNRARTEPSPSHVGLGLIAGALAACSSYDTQISRTSEALDLVAVVVIAEDLGTLPGADTSRGYAINASRQIVGHSAGGSLGLPRAFIWTPPGPMQQLPLLNPPAPDSRLERAFDINDLGQVTGHGSFLGCEPSCLSEGYVWAPPGDVVPFGGFGGASEEEGVAINNLGWVAGKGEVSTFAPTLWIPPGPNAPFPGMLGVATDLNDGGEVVGSFSSPAPGGAFYWAGGDVLTLPEPGAGGNALAAGINETGAIVGALSIGGDYRAVIWSNVGAPPDELGTLGGAQSSAAAINDNAAIVGGSETPTGEWHAFRRFPGGELQDLGTLGGSLSGAEDVHDAGHVVGYASLPGGSVHAAAWWSYNEPDSYSCNCQPWAPAPPWEALDFITILIPGTSTLPARLIDPAVTRLGDGDGNDAGVAIVDGRNAAEFGDFDGDGLDDLLVAFDRREVVAKTPAAAERRSLLLAAALLDRSNAVVSTVRVAQDFKSAPSYSR